MGRASCVKSSCPRCGTLTVDLLRRGMVRTLISPLLMLPNLGVADAMLTLTAIQNSP